MPGRPDLFLLERGRVDRGLQSVLFSALSEAPERRLRMAQIAEDIFVTRSGVSRLVDRLQANGILNGNWIELSGGTVCLYTGTRSEE